MSSRPIIVNEGNATANKVLKENCGLVVNANSVEDITEAIKQLQSNPTLCATLGKNGRKAYEQHYKWDLMEQRLHGLYGELLNWKNRYYIFYKIKKIKILKIQVKRDD